MAIHCTADQLVHYFDEQSIRDLLSDNGQPVTATLSADPKLAELLKSASGRLEGACFVSKNYSATELADMSDNSKALAAEICAYLTMAMLMRRRPERFNAETCRGMAEDAENYLQQLRNGARLFDVGDHADAGTPQVEFPTTVEIQDLNAITQRTRNFYPRPERRLPISRGGG